MANLPVREMVLYKHGVGFFVRQGAVTGEKVALTFREDEINDVLKSLAVFDQAGGQVLGIHYQTPMDRDARLASSSVRLSQQKSLRDLLRDLRGRDCQLTVEMTSGTQETLTGRIIGIDEIQTQEEFSATISILTQKGVQVLPYDSLRNIQIVDDQSAHDLSYFLDTSMAEDERRVVNVRLSEGEHDLALYYVAPSPTWRVSYRLVAETDEDSSTGKALLQGWGLFDNRLEEDLDNVRVTLVAGQPISFIYELYASRIPYRPTVNDESRVAPGPIEFAGGALHNFQDDVLEESQAADYMAQAAEPHPLFFRASASRPTRKQAQSSTKVQSESKDTGETFQYMVTTPVSVKRGESAMVPIIGKDVNYQRELLYNGSKMPKHPVAALRFDNNTGLTLEHGPVTVVEDGDYKGEAVIPFTKEDIQVYVPYAVELGIVVTEKLSRTQTIAGLNIKEHALVEQRYDLRKMVYTIENNTAKAQVVTIEAPIYSQYELYNTRTPDFETPNERRWHVSVAAHDKTTFTINERQLYEQRYEIESLDYIRLFDYLDNEWLDQTTFTHLNDILKAVQETKNAEKEIKNLLSERDEIYKQQEQLRANLGALQPTGQEANLRNRLLNQLESTQDRLDAIDDDIVKAKQSIEDNRVAIEKMLQALD